MGCYLEDYRARVGTWAGRFLWCGVPRLGAANGRTGDCLGLMVLSVMGLAILLMIGRTEQNPGPVVEVKNTMRLLCNGCCRNLKLGIQCELRERWYHYSCGSMTAQAACNSQIISSRTVTASVSTVTLVSLAFRSSKTFQAFC